MKIREAQWISRRGINPKTVPVFRLTFSLEKEVKRALLEVTAAGVYDAYLNGQRVGDLILTPGWTEYHKRLQVQCFDVKEYLEEGNPFKEVTYPTGPAWQAGLSGISLCHI